MRENADVQSAFAAIGTDRSSGTRLFCLSGCVEQPGLYEHEFGVTLRQVIEAAGGVRGGRPLRAVLLGGADETALASDVMRELGGVGALNLSGKTSLRDLIAIFSECEAAFGPVEPAPTRKVSPVGIA